ncbi:MAG: hypothetical protein LBL46_03665 [Rickettsiales bacterium]|jgi:cell division protein FtsI (penicillin-binding protein 3)|nr:hypothetical protein [Rickettsiales bacterium]
MMPPLGNDILQSMRARAARPTMRKSAALAAAFFCFAFMAGRTIILGTGGERRLRRAPEMTASAMRADITDRNGLLLAKNVYSETLKLNARIVKRPDELALLVHSVFPDIAAADILNKIKTRGGDITLRENITKDQAAAIRAKPLDGLVIENTQRRFYPKKFAAAHIVGFVGKEGRGLEGMELYANNELLDGQSVRLAADSRVQSIMWDELSKAMAAHNADAAMGAIMNARTGEIVAMVSLPDFDPDHIADYPASNRRNRMMADSFELGSVFKIFNTALALSSGIPADKSYNIVEPIIHNGKRIPMGEARGFNPPAKNLSVKQIMQYSCNVGSAKMALDLPAGAQLSFFKELGFDRPMATDFGRTARRSFPRGDNPTDRTRWAIGHGISITPMQLLVAANAAANGGLLVYPTIYPRDFVPQSSRIVRPDVSKTIRDILFSTKETTGREAAKNIQGVNYGGKTSTAQKLMPDGTYSPTKNLAAFFATWPIEAPKYSMLVILDNPKTYPRTAAYSAAPAATRIMDAAIPMLQ